MTIKLPYFDYLMDAFAKGHSGLEQSFGHHVHWGYWPFPAQAKGDSTDFVAAAEQLSELIYHSAKVTNSQAVLDVGCGFGGTIAALNQRYQDMDLVGLNIDERQLLRAREQVLPSGTNRIRFQQGDACALPFADHSFDVVLAVECIFHFPSREQFFKEANRVLKPGGYLALSDFLLSPKLAKLSDFSFSGYLTDGFFGKCNVQFTRQDYQALADNSGFSLALEKDITLNTLPTYPYLRSLAKQPAGLKISLKQGISMVSAILSVEFLSRVNALQYFVYAFRK
ncbi:methyltransferase domain-containing protein [Methylomonas paludis]|uniref:Methyltransferase domain-containing protein n=1 Tax=Methylomonas paludis TaxID=1173101 RepID=A0A975MP29_9GAMM|nr:class I SAM-dependent methyltransferase [Methylomonas paludis]QWF71423.1 methyltransferase domain-containing protein [Methylomonas paludis]